MSQHDATSTCKKKKVKKIQVFHYRCKIPFKERCTALGFYGFLLTFYNVWSFSAMEKSWASLLDFLCSFSSISAKEVMWLVRFVCLSASKIAETFVGCFSWNMVEGLNSGGRSRSQSRFTTYSGCGHSVAKALQCGVLHIKTSTSSLWLIEGQLDGSAHSVLCSLL